MADLKQLKCPSCGAILNQSFPNQLIVECPYCHQQVVNETFQSSGNDKEPYVLEFSMKEEDVVKTMVNMLVEDQCVPTDIFDKMKITSIMKFYAPVYMFEGTYRASWNAEIPRDEMRQRIGKDGKIEDYFERQYDYPSGEVVGNFSVLSIPNKELYDLRLDIEDLQKVSVNPTILPRLSTLSTQIDDTIKIVYPSSDSNFVWRESGESIAKIKGTAAAASAKPGYVTDCSSICELKRTFYVLIPIWIIDYCYDESPFTFFYYGEQYGSMTSPVCEFKSAQPTEDEIKILNSEKAKKESFDTGMGCIIMFVFLGLGVLIAGEFFNISFCNAIKRNGGFFWIVGLALVFLALNYYFNDVSWSVIDAIDKTKKNIERRTQLLRNEEENYKRKKSVAFLKSNYEADANLNSHMIRDQVTNKEEAPTPLNDFKKHETKICIHCGKTINANHLFCRFCGGKQS